MFRKQIRQLLKQAEVVSINGVKLRASYAHMPVNVEDLALSVMNDYEDKEVHFSLETLMLGKIIDDILHLENGQKLQFFQLQKISLKNANSIQS